MATLLEFLASVKATEYLLAIGFVVLFILYWEILNREPSSSLDSDREENSGGKRAA